MGRQGDAIPGGACGATERRRAGARLVALDHSERQLEGVGRLQQKFGVDFTLVHASAEDVPLPDESFDLVLSEYGVSLWCDPELWVPEAARVLRPGGRLVFVGESPFVVMCLSDDGSALTTSLLRPYFNLYPLPWPGSDSLQFGLGYGGWIQLLGANGLAVDTLTEVLAPEGGDPGRWDYLNADWGRQWPTELIWTARKQR